MVVKNQERAAPQVAGSNGGPSLSSLTLEIHFSNRRVSSTDRHETVYRNVLWLVEFAVNIGEKY